MTISQAWDRMGLRMDGFHNYFRMEYKTIYELASRYEEQHISLREFLQTARGLHSRKYTFSTVDVTSPAKRLVLSRPQT